MDNEKKYTTSLRLYKDRPVHVQAYRCLKNYNTDIFRTKDDFIAEAVVCFSKYLKQDEEQKRMEEFGRFFQENSRPLMELVKTAVLEVQTSQMEEMIKSALKEALADADLVSGSTAICRNTAEEQDIKRDLAFANFYEFGDE